MQCNLNCQKLTLHFGKNTFLGYFAKLRPIVRENGPKIGDTSLNLVWLGGKFSFQCNSSFACLGMWLLKSDRNDLILPFFWGGAHPNVLPM